MRAETPQGLWPPLRYVYAKNPFYFISTVFVLYGAVHGVDPGAKPFLMAGLLVGYCSLLAAAGYAIVRFGQVWDDARSVLLILLFLFVALSISLDEVVTANLIQGTAALLAGLLFCLGISAVLFRGLKIRLPVAFKAPYYAMLTLLFTFPLVPAIVSQKLLGRSVLDWAVLSLSPLSGLMFLLLIPAVRRGAAYVKDNGTPWRWPLYPWSIFVMLACGLAFRMYWSCLTFQHGRDLSCAFGFYYLNPLLLAVVVLLLEAGITSGKRKLRRLALIAPLLLVSLTFMTQGIAQLDHHYFVGELARFFGTPVFLTVVAVAVYYAYATIRGVVRADLALSASLLLLSVVDRQRTMTILDVVAPQVWPLVLLAVAQGWLTVRRRTSPHALAAAYSGIAALTVSQWNTAILTLDGAIPVHLTLAATLAVAYFYHDRFARTLREFGAVMLALIGIAAIATHHIRFAGVAQWLSWAIVVGYTTTLMSAAVGLWFLWRDRRYLGAAGANLAACCAQAAVFVYAVVRDSPLAKLIAYLSLGLLFFLVALAISTTKARLVQQAWKRDEGG